MIDIWHIAMVAGASVALAVSWHDMRARGWLFLIVAVYAFGCALRWLDMPDQPFLVALSDAAICVAVSKYGAYKWEMLIFRLFQFSVLISIMRHVGIIEAHFVYIAILEAVNWLAFLVIGATAYPQKRQDNEKFSAYRGLGYYFHMAIHTLQQKRKSPPGARTAGTR